MKVLRDNELQTLAGEIEAFKCDEDSEQNLNGGSEGKESQQVDGEHDRLTEQIYCVIP